jgi:hypothetical protein
MLDLGVDLALVRSWFPHLQETPYILIRVSREHAQTWADTLKVSIRRCYITDQILLGAADQNQITQAEVIAAKLPDPGATMSGDFGEIITYLYQGARQQPASALGVVKWRLKQDRTKPAPHSDVVHVVLPSWPTPTADDCVFCAEVKTKATAGNSTPIANAIEDSKKDRVSRLARTLEWLRERPLTESVGDFTLDQLEPYNRSNLRNLRRGPGRVHSNPELTSIGDGPQCGYRTSTPVQCSATRFFQSPKVCHRVAIAALVASGQQP